MSARRRTGHSQDDSGGGWSDPGRGASADAHPADADADADADAAPHPFRADEDDRYDRRDVAGEGGMGRVYVATDRRLGREVALKQISRAVDDPATAARLAREATITARLEHPGIVPVHDAGVGPDGRLFYTMRLVRGRSLADALAAAADLPARLALLRHFLAACQAIAYAHSRGVVHRDLKPANVMVGEFGETIVVDWGLACTVDEESPAAVGTPAYMSPEQAAGAPADRRADVWSLGAVLHEIITGARLGATRAPGGAAGAPAELVAIADKALVRDAAGRYADAGELAADVERFLDGRRVAAHEYTSFELLRRLVHAWRVPLAVAAVGVAAVVVVGAVTYRRVLAERARALGAEERTRAALGEARAELGRALVGQALSAHEAGARAEAELFAAHALAIAESPEARGVIASAYAGARPRGATRTGVPGCPRLVPAGPRRALCIGLAELALWELGDPDAAGAGAAAPRRRWTRPVRADEAVLLHDDRVVLLTDEAWSVVLDAHDGRELARHDGASQLHGIVADALGRRYATTDGGREIMVVDLADGRRRELGRVCETRLMPTYALGGERLVVVCGEGRVLVIDLEQPPGALPEVVLVPFGVSQPASFSSAVHPDGRRAALGSIDGQLMLLDLDDGSFGSPWRVADGPVHRVAFAGELVLVQADRGGSALWDPGRRVELLRLPVAASRGVFGEAGGVVGAGEALWRWRLPEVLVPWRFDAPAGLSSAAVSPDGALLALTRGDGRVSLWSRRDGRPLAELAPTRAVVKRADFSPDGRHLAVCMSDTDGTRVYDTRTWQPAAHEQAGRGVQRLFWLKDGRLVGLHYGEGFFLWGPGGAGPRVEVRAPRAYDAVPLDAAGGFLLLTREGKVLRWYDGTLSEVLDEPGAHSLSASPDGRVVALAHDRGVRVHVDGAAPRWLPDVSGDVLDVAISPDRRWLAVGSRGGNVDLWTLPEGRHAASLRGHRERAAAMTFTPDGALVTTSWDGTAQTWNLEVLSTPPATLVEAAERDWGQDLPTALRGRLQGVP